MDIQYLFASRLAVSCSLLYSVREVWFASSCYSRQGNSCARASLCSRSDLDTADVNRDRILRGAILENFAVYQPRRATFKSVKPHQRRGPRGRSSNDESLQNEGIFRKLLSQITTVVFLVYPTAFSYILAMPLGEDS